MPYIAEDHAERAADRERKGKQPLYATDHTGGAKLTTISAMKRKLVEYANQVSYADGPNAQQKKQKRVQYTTPTTNARVPPTHVMESTHTHRAANGGLHQAQAASGSKHKVQKVHGTVARPSTQSKATAPDRRTFDEGATDARKRNYGQFAEDSRKALTQHSTAQRLRPPSGISRPVPGQFHSEQRAHYEFKLRADDYRNASIAPMGSDAGEEVASEDPPPEPVKLHKSAGRKRRRSRSPGNYERAFI